MAIVGGEGVSVIDGIGMMDEERKGGHCDGVFVFWVAYLGKFHSWCRTWITFATNPKWAWRSGMGRVIPPPLPERFPDVGR